MPNDTFVGVFTDPKNWVKKNKIKKKWKKKNNHCFDVTNWANVWNVWAFGWCWCWRTTAIECKTDRWNTMGYWMRWTALRAPIQRAKPTILKYRDQFQWGWSFLFIAPDNKKKKKGIQMALVYPTKVSLLSIHCGRCFLIALYRNIWANLKRIGACRYVPSPKYESNAVEWEKWGNSVRFDVMIAYRTL